MSTTQQFLSRLRNLRELTVGGLKNSCRRVTMAGMAIVIATTLVYPSAPATAQVATFDNSSFLQLKQTLTTVQSELGQLQSIFATVQKLQSAIGQLGSLANISGILSSLTSMGKGLFSNPLKGIQPQLGSISSFGSMGSNSSFTTGFSQLTSAFNQASNGVAAVKSTLTSALYLTSGNPSPSQAAGIAAVRAVNLREAATNAAATGIQGRTTTATNAATDTNELASKAAASQDLRGDIQANNAIMLKILEALQQNNAQIASLVHLSGASAISQDSVTSGSGTSN